jgi:hypothetical protein
MSQPAIKPTRRCFTVFFLLGFVLTIAGRSASGADLKLQARLVWGANDNPATINFNLTDPELTTCLRHNFPKWTNYFEITNLTSVIPLNETREFRMSDRCTLKVKNLGGSAVAVDCIGQGKPVSKGTNTLPCIYSGTATNETGWFIQLRTVEDKK